MLCMIQLVDRDPRVILRKHFNYIHLQMTRALRMYKDWVVLSLINHIAAIVAVHDNWSENCQ